jgi:hypothetical protein
MTTTVLIDETATLTNRHELFHLLLAGTTQGFIAVRKGNSFKSYGARVVSWLELPDQPSLNSRCIIIPMSSSTRTDLLVPTDPRIVRQAKKLQRQLLQFRLTNYKSLSLLKIAGQEKLQPRTRDLYHALALPLGEQKEACEWLLALLKPQESLREVLSANQMAILDLLYEVLHCAPEANGFRIKNLTEWYNANLQQRHEPGRLSERKFGDILTSLKLTNRSRTNVGFVLWCDRGTREHIHSLARTFGVAGSTPEMSAQCELCQTMGGASTTQPIAESERAEAKRPRERREPGKRRIKRKPAKVA